MSVNIESGLRTQGQHAAKTSVVSKTPWKAVFAASIGSALEFYDLLIYGFFAVTIGRQFFPAENESTSLLLSVGTFGISFVMRPLGAVILGNYADKAGRKASLTMSILLMMIGTAIITFCPSFTSIGIAAPLLIILARMLQGFSTGGEFGAATAFMTEHADPKRRGFFASWQISTQGLATVLSAGISALLSFLLPLEQLNDWGWRIAFLFGLLIGPVGMYIRSQINETPEFLQVMAEKARVEKLARKKTVSPFVTLLRNDALNLLLGIGVVAGATSFTYVHKLYMPTYATTQLHLQATSSYLGAFMAGAALMVAAPLFGALSDKIGKFKVLAVALFLVGCSSYPIFLMPNTWPTITVLFSVQLFVGLLLAACLGPTPALLSEIFPTETRGTGLALSYNVSVTIFGGFAPLIVTWMIEETGNKMSPSYYVTTTAVISVISVLWLGKRIGSRLTQS